MAFPSSNGTQGFTVAQALQLAQGVASIIKSQASNLSAQCAAGPVQASVILNLLTVLADAKLNLTKCAAVPGLATYAQAQTGDANIATEFTAMSSALDAVTQWVIANFPTGSDGTGTYLLVTQFTPDNTGRTQQRTFTTVQTAGLKTVLDALVATIN